MHCLPHASGAARTHYNQLCCLQMRRDKTRQIPHSKLPRRTGLNVFLTFHKHFFVHLWRTDTKFKCPVDRLNLLCCDAASGLDTVHCSATEQASVNFSSARALCGIGFAAYVATFLVGIFHLPLSRSYFASLEKASQMQTWPARRLRSRELEDTCTNADGWHEWKWFQIGDVVFGFPTRSIAHHKIN